MQQLSLWKREHPLQMRLAISSHEATVNQKNDFTLPISLHNLPYFQQCGSHAQILIFNESLLIEL